MAKQKAPPRKDIITFFLLVFLGVITQFVAIPLHFGLTFNLGAIWYFVAIRVLNYKTSLIVALLISVITFALDRSHPLIFIAVLEVAIIGYLYKKKNKDLFTWAFLYAILTSILLYSGAWWFNDTEASVTLGRFLFLGNLVQLSIAALLADMIAVYLPYLPVFKRANMKKQQVSFSHMIFNAIVVAAVIPLLSLMIIHANEMKDATFSTYTSRYQLLESNINEYSLQIDDNEIQHMHLGSIIEKAHLIHLFDQFISDNDEMIYLLEPDGTVFVQSSNAEPYDRLEERLSNGQDAEFGSNQIIWVNGTGTNVRDWKNGYYAATTSFFNKQVELYIPMKEAVISSLTILTSYFLMITIVFIVAFMFGTIGNYILKRSLTQLMERTSELPSRIGRQEPPPENQTRINELWLFGKNIEEVSYQLDQMFSELQEKNKLLTERTNQLVQSEQELYYVAHYDGLTQLPNRLTFYQDLNQLIDSNCEWFALVFIDLNKFKEINDTYGHSRGDEILCQFAKLILSAQQKIKGLKIYRLAGDEFVGTIHSLPKETVNSTLNQLLEAISQPLQLGNTNVYLTASVGVSFYPEDGQTVDELLHTADTAMYQQKRLAKSGVTFYEGGGANDFN